MSATALTPSTRQPFGSVSQARLRALANTKNSQNALSAASTPSSKQIHPLVSDLDLENIDPTQCLPTSKFGTVETHKTGDFKTPHFSLNTVQPVKHATSLDVVGRKRKADDTVPPSTPSKRRMEDAPIHLAGRSPPKRMAGLFSRRHTRKAVTRIDPPSKDTHLPFSLNAALAGTIPLKSKKRPSKKGWDFSIYEDTPQDEMANLMEHSTCTLDISDDESRSSKGDRDNKENVPPANSPEAMTAIVARREAADQEIRSPLNDLNTKEFYAQGCDDSSVFIVPADEETQPEADVAAPAVTDEITPTEAADPSPVAQGQEGWENIIAKLSDKSAEAEGTADNNNLCRDSTSDIHIWESESAKAEEEARNHPTEAAA